MAQLEDEEKSTDEESAILSEFDYHDTINSENCEKYFEKFRQIRKLLVLEMSLEIFVIV